MPKGPASLPKPPLGQLNSAGAGMVLGEWEEGTGQGWAELGGPGWGGGAWDVAFRAAWFPCFCAHHFAGTDLRLEPPLVQVYECAGLGSSQPSC